MAQGSPDTVSYSGRLFPSGKVSVGLVPAKKVARNDARYEAARPEHVSYRKEHWHYEDGLQTEIVDTLEYPPELGLASVSNHHKEKQRKYGLKGISSGGRTSVREGAYLLEQKYGHRLGFYTLTCPYTDLNSIYSYNQNIGYIQRTYFQELRREYERQGVTWSYVSVIEIQAERFSDTGVPVLHLHYLAPCYVPNSTLWVCTADMLRDLWSRVLRNAVGGENCTSAAVDAQVVHSSAVGYISKYMSKGSKETSFLAEVCPDQLPSQWWSVSSNVRKAIKASTIRLPQEVCADILHRPCSDPSHPLYLRYCRLIYVPINGEDKLVGLSGNMIPSVSYRVFSLIPLSTHCKDI